MVVFEKFKIGDMVLGFYQEM